jgi:hypothetical protein
MRTMPRRTNITPASKAAKLIGSLGGKARAKNLSAAKRAEIARSGAAARWKGKKKSRGK